MYFFFAAGAAAGTTSKQSGQIKSQVVHMDVKLSFKQIVHSELEFEAGCPLNFYWCAE